MPKQNKQTKIAAQARLKEAKELLGALDKAGAVPEAIALAVGATVHTIARWRTGTFAPGRSRLALLRKYAVEQKAA